MRPDQRCPADRGGGSPRIMLLTLCALIMPVAALQTAPPLHTLNVARAVTSQQRSFAPRAELGDEAAPQTTVVRGALRRRDDVMGVIEPISSPPPSSAISGDEYQRGLATVGFITLLFASNSPVLRSAFTSVEHVPPVLLVGAVTSLTALSGLLVGGPLLGSLPTPSTLEGDATDAIDATSLRAGAELGTWKFIGTLFNLYGLSLTSADHGAFLIQLTTLIVPVVQGIMGVPIPRQIWIAVGVALSGLLIFTTDTVNAAGAASAQGDAACVCAALCYALYDLRLFVYGRQVTPLRLIQNKVGAQALLSMLALVLLGREDAVVFASAVTPDELSAIVPLVLWSGIVVNGIAPFLQVGGQQAVGPARAQVIYASGPLWAALLSLIFLGETVGPQGVVGGAAFLAAVLLAASTPAPDPDCDEAVCEV